MGVYPGSSDGETGIIIESETLRRCIQEECPDDE